MSIHKRLTINSISNLIKYLTYFMITLSLTPFIIRGVGDYTYGLWISMLSIIGYAGILEMGIQAAMIKLVAEYKAVDDTSRINRLTVTAFLFYLGVGVISSVLIWSLLPHLLHHFVHDPQDMNLARKTLVVLGIDLYLIFLGNVFTGMIYGLQLYHYRNLVDMGGAILNAAGTFLLLKRGGIFSLMLVKTSTDLVTLIAGYWLCRKTFPGWHFDVRLANRDSFRELFKVGGRIFASTTAARLTNSADALIISAILGTNLTAIYYIPKRLLDYLKEIVWALTTGFMPTFSELQRRNDPVAVRRIYIDYTRYILILVLPPMVAIAVHGSMFIRLWINPEYAEKGRTVLYLLAASLFVFQLQPLQGRLLIGVGKIDIIMKNTLATSIVYLGLCLALTPRMGIAGIGWATLVSSSISQLVFIVSVCRYLDIGIPALLATCHMRVMLAALCEGIAMLALKVWQEPRTYGGIASQIALTLPPYAILVYAFVLNQRERDYSRGRVRLLLRK